MKNHSPVRKILIVDDEAAVRRMIRTTLEMRKEFTCLEAPDTMQARKLLHEEQPDLMLLDWMLSGISGIELLRQLRSQEENRDLPVIMLTAKDTERSMVRGLEQGADDYITKPFSPRELVARIHAVLRRRGEHREDAVLSAGPLTLDPVQHHVSCAGQPVHLRPMEFRLLHFFMSHPGRTYSRGALLNQVWGANAYLEERTLDVHISRLRRVLKGCGDCSRWVDTVVGFGYRFTPPTS